MDIVFICTEVLWSKIFPSMLVKLQPRSLGPLFLVPLGVTSLGLFRDTQWTSPEHSNSSCKK